MQALSEGLASITATFGAQTTTTLLAVQRGQVDSAATLAWTVPPIAANNLEQGATREIQVHE